MLRFYTLFILVLIFQTSFCQIDSTKSILEIDPLRYVQTNTIEKKNFFKVAWAPVGLMLLSADLMRDSTKYGLQDILRSPVSDTFRTNADDYLQYVPIGMMYMADLFKIPAKNTVWNQTKFLAMSELFTAGLIHALKFGFKVQRPNNGPYNSYPSGHTSQAFVASQVFYNEFRETNKLLALSGFLFSVPTGYLRILNNRHWLPDVLLGAGIAMLVTNTVYYFEPLKNWNPWKKKDRNIDVGFVPSISEDYFGGHLTLRF